MKLVFAPSGKRIIAYPPVGIALLAASLAAAGQPAEPYDLEIALASRRLQGRSVLIYEDAVSTSDVLTPTLSAAVAEYGDELWDLIGGGPGVRVGISVMGFEQLASALLLGRVAMEHGGQVMFGGQFWTEMSAAETIHALSPYGRAVVTVGDGWEAVVMFARGAAPEEMPNSYSGRAGEVVAGPRIVAKTLPPQPTYSWVPWPEYESFGAATYQNPAPVRRAHLYVWDKQCNFRCAFCRVASGSRAVLTPPAVAMRSFEELVGTGVGQLNVMTNELNPSRTYMLRFLSELQSRGIVGAHWFTYVRADRLERDDFARMRAVGGRLARYGIESGSQRLLDLMRKDYQISTMEQTLAASATEDIWNHVNLLIGFPGEQDADIEQTLGFLERNAAAIHSVRINPFYLPPDTPIAREPEAYGIRLSRFDRGWWQFVHEDGTAPDEDEVVRRVERVSAACVELGIGFAGADPFFLLDMISRCGSRSEAIGFVKDRYPLFWVPAPTDAYKAMIGGYESTSDWREIVLKRQRNYSLSICTD